MAHHFDRHGIRDPSSELLRRYLLKAEAQGLSTIDALGCDPSIFPFADWPQLERTDRRKARSGDGTGVAVPYLAQVVASLGTVNASERVAPYLDLLDRVLEDSQVTGEEAEALQATAVQWGLTREDVVSAHHAYLEALVAAAVADGRVTGAELRDLEAATRLLAIDPSILHALLTRTMEDPG